MGLSIGRSQFEILVREKLLSSLAHSDFEGMKKNQFTVHKYFYFRNIDDYHNVGQNNPHPHLLLA